LDEKNNYKLAEIYKICCEICKYNDIQLKEIKNKLKINDNEILIYNGNIFIKKYLLINIFINCFDISKFICSF
jgi:hypothetical protein